MNSLTGLYPVVIVQRLFRVYTVQCILYRVHYTVHWIFVPCTCTDDVSVVNKLSVHVDEVDASKPLQITHFPQIQGSESTKVPTAVQVSEMLSSSLQWHRHKG